MRCERSLHLLLSLSSRSSLAQIEVGAFVADANATWLATWVSTANAIAMVASAPLTIIRCAVGHSGVSANAMALANVNLATLVNDAIAWTAMSIATIRIIPM